MVFDFIFFLNSKRRDFRKSERKLNRPFGVIYRIRLRYIANVYFGYLVRWFSISTSKLQILEFLRYYCHRSTPKDKLYNMQITNRSRKLDDVALFY